MHRRGFITGAAATLMAAPAPLPRVHLGVMDGTFGLATKPEAATLAHKLGFTHMQVTLGRPVADRLPLSNAGLQRTWREAAIANDIELHSTYIDVLHQDCLKNSAEALAWAEEGIRITSALGARILMLVFFGKCSVLLDTEQQALVEPLRRLAPIAQKHSVVLGVENTVSAEANLRLLHKVNSPAVKIWYDIGNATNMGGFDISKEIHLLGRDAICEFHIKDRGWLGEGKVDVRAAARAIRDIGYTGVCTFETGSPTKDVFADTARQRDRWVEALKSEGVTLAAG